MPTPAADPTPIIVIPCYNEEHRLDEAAFGGLARSGRLQLLFVDDGSTDGTAGVLHRLASLSDAISLLTLPDNQGKSEAVRRGLIEASTRPTPLVGYFDADLATPIDELLRLVSILEADDELTAVFGSRVARLGSTIERTPLRHYLGRICATAASMALGVVVYDTQCGAKVFRAGPELSHAIATPFASKWAFDVELLDRLLRGPGSLPGIPVEAFLEVPLASWKDVRGSHVRLSAGIEALAQITALGLRRRRHRA